MDKTPILEALPDELSKDELERLDNLLAAARWFNYAAFTLSGFSIALSSLEKMTEIKLPIGDVNLPGLQAIIGLYILVLVLTLASERFFNMALPWLRLDKRRPPFAWIALSSKEPTGQSVIFWLLMPVLLCAIATANSLAEKDVTGYFLSFLGIIIVFSPRTIDECLYLIRKKLDHRGGTATFSIWLLYWYRLIRNITMTIFFFLPVIAVLPKWRNSTLNIAMPIIVFGVAMYVLRLIAGIPVIYRFIDRIGFKCGFPKESKHYQ